MHIFHESPPLRTQSQDLPALFPVTATNFEAVLALQYRETVLTDDITHTTAFVTPVVKHWQEREIAQWVHHMKDRSDDPSHHEQAADALSRSYVMLFVLRSYTI